MKLKICAKCKVEKEVNEFYLSKRDGYRSRCKLCKKEDDFIWRSNNYETDKKVKKNWRDNNKEYMITYYKDNKEKITNYNIEYYQENKEEIKKRVGLNRNEYMKKHYKKYPHIHIHRGLLSRYYTWIGESKLDKTHILLGYTAKELKLHLESLFTDGMSWSNFGEWHVDHIKPVSKFNKMELPSVVNSLTNLQPIWAYENLKKGARYEQS